VSQLWSGGQRGEEDRVDQKQHGGGSLNMKSKQLGGCNGRMPEPLEKIVVDGIQENVKALCSLWHGEI